MKIGLIKMISQGLGKQRDVIFYFKKPWDSFRLNLRKQTRDISTNKGTFTKHGTREKK